MPKQARIILLITGLPGSGTNPETINSKFSPKKIDSMHMPHIQNSVKISTNLHQPNQHAKFDHACMPHESGKDTLAEQVEQVDRLPSVSYSNMLRAPQTDLQQRVSAFG